MVKNNFITILDLGTSKTTAFMVRLEKNNSFSIICSSLVDTRGLEQGRIVDLSQASDTIAEVIGKLEEKSKLRVSSLFTNISTPDLRGQSIKAAVSIADKPSQITAKDLERVKDNAKNIALPFDREVVHLIAQSYSVDGHSDIKNPLGLSATHLEGNFYLITAPLASVQNIMKAVNNVGLNLSGLVFTAWALSQELLSEEEKNDGVILLDLGAGTAKIIIFVKGQVRAMEVIPLGGNDLTINLSNELRLPLRNAEELKRRYSATTGNSLDENKIMLNEEDSFRSISRRQFNQILDKEWAGILNQLLERVKKMVNFNQITSGIVVSGGGVLMDNSLEKIENIFSLPVRLGAAKNIFDKNSSHTYDPIYATSYSLISYVVRNYKLNPFNLPAPKNIWDKMIRQTKEILQDYF